MIAAPASHRLAFDLADYFSFYFGMLLFALRRADMATKAKNNALASRRDYFSLNWVVLLIRAALQSPVLYAWQHYTVADMTSWLGVTWRPPVTIPNIPIVALLLGYFSYTGLDWVITKRAPAWVKEQIPELPGNGQTAMKISAANGGPQT